MFASVAESKVSIDSIFILKPYIYIQLRLLSYYYKLVAIDSYFYTLKLRQCNAISIQAFNLY